MIDDEESVRSVLSRILTQVKHQVNVAKDGEEGIRLFHEGEFDIVLTDLGMPGMSGWDVCRAIKKMSPQTPVGMITGWGMEIGEEKMKEVELDFLISKPFDFNTDCKYSGEDDGIQGDVNLSTPRPEDRGLLEVHPEPRFLTPSLKTGLRGRTGDERCERPKLSALPSISHPEELPTWIEAIWKM